MSENILCVSEFIDDKLPYVSVGKLIQNFLLSQDKDATAIIDVKSGENFTYKSLLELSLNLAAQLRSFGISKNDIVGVISENSVKYIIALYACFFIATPLHLINPAYTTYELRKILNLSKPRLVFCSKLCLDNILKLREDLNFIEILVIFDDDLDSDSLRGAFFYKNLVKTRDADFEIETEIDIQEHVAYICNSSGTTGMPKGVMLTHHTIRANFIQNLDTSIVPQDIICVLEVLPLYHIFGVNTCIIAIARGIKVILNEKFHPDVFLSSIQKYRVRCLFVVPSLMHFLCTSPMLDKYDLTSLKHVFLGAGPCKDEITEAVEKRLNAKIYQVYGLSELCLMVATTPLYSDMKKGSCGRLTPGHKIKILDTRTSEILSSNQIGEICVKGFGMKGYINDVEKTRETIDSDGFLRTGDVGYYDEDGFLFIVDRLKDLIKYKSFQVAPAEIEEIIVELDGIEDVAVVGKFDERFGELPVAFVVKKSDARVAEFDIIKRVAGFLSEEKRLHGGVRFVDCIPRNSIGKVLRKELREML